MCSLATPNFDQEVLRRSSVGRRFRPTSRGAVPRLAPSGGPRFVLRWNLPLYVMAGLLLFGASPAARAQVTFNGTVSTVNTGGLPLADPPSTVMDSAGNLYISSYGSSQIVKITPQGVSSYLNITGLNPGLAGPWGLAMSPVGNLYIADYVNKRVVEVSPSGSGSVVNLGSITLVGPTGVAVDSSGNLFIGDASGNQIVEVTAGGTASVLSISGLGVALNYPVGIAVDVSGNLYIADYGNNRIVKVAAGGTAGTIVGISGLNPGLAGPQAVAADKLGNLFVADYGNSRVIELAPGGAASVVSTGSLTLSQPYGVTADPLGNLYIADPFNSRIVTVATSAVGFGHLSIGTATGVTQVLPFTVPAGTTLGSIATLTQGTQNLDFSVVAAGTTCASGTTNTTCTVNVQFLPTAPGLRRGALVLYDGSGNPLITVPLYAFADAPVAALAPDNALVIGTRGVTTQFPFQLALDGAGNIYVANYAQTLPNPKVVKIPAGGGSASAVGTPGVTLGPSITGIALDGAGNLFIADYDNSRIVVVTPGGVASVLSIGGLSPALGEPTDLAFDAAGNLYIADYSTGRIVEVSSLVVAGVTSSGVGTIVNTGAYTFGASTITGVGVGPNGTVYIAARTSNNSSIVQATAAGVASLLAPSGLTLSDPQGVAVDGMGNIYIEDSGNSRIVRITTSGATSVVSILGLTSPTTLASGYGVTADPSGNIFIPDWTNNRIIEVPVSGASLAFPNTALGASSSPQTATLTNLGNQSLIFGPANPVYTPDFSLNSGDTGLCAAASPLLAGAVCDISVDFTPQSVASLNEAISVGDNSLNVGSSTQLVSVNGTAQQGSTTTVVTDSASGSSTYGQTVVLTATITPSSSLAPTGTVTFTNTTTSVVLGSVPVSAGVGTLHWTPTAAGTYAIGATYNGDANYLTSSGADSIAFNKAPLTVTASSTVLAYGGTAPAVTPSYSAFAGTDTVASLATAPTCTTTATVSTPVGTDTGANTCAGAVDSNYNFTYVPGNVTVGKATLTITASGTSMSYGGMPPAVTPGYSAFAGTDTAASLTAPPTCITTATTATPAGTYTGANTCSGAVDSNYAFTYVPGNVTVNKASAVIMLAPSANPAPVFSALTFTATVSSPAGTPTGSVSFIDGTNMLSSKSLGAGVAAYTSSTLSLGAHSVTAAYSGDANFLGITSPPVSEQITAATPTINWSPPLGFTYGNTLSLILNATATIANSPVAGSFSYTVTPTGGARSTATPATLLTVGTYTLTAAFAPTDTTDYQSASLTVPFTVTKGTATISLTSSQNPVLATNSVTFTATVSSTASTPTGTVSFFDGPTLLGSPQTLTGGVATYTTASLTIATHSITTIYSGDANFNSVTSAALAQTVEDFTLVFTSTPGVGTPVVFPGGSATYSFQINPTSGPNLPSAVLFTISGLPSGAKATFTPSSLPAGSAGTTLTLVVQLANQILAHNPAKPLGGGLALAMAGGMLLLPFGTKLRRRAGNAGRIVGLTLLLLAATCAAMGLTACGGGGNSYFGQQVKNYTLTITATSGGLSHTSTVNLTVQ